MLNAAFMTMLMAANNTVCALHVTSRHPRL